MTRPAFLVLDGWAGRSLEPVVVIGETPKRYRVRNPGASPVQLAGRNRWLAPGETALVPKRAVKFHSPPVAAEEDPHA